MRSLALTLTVAVALFAAQPAEAHVNVGFDGDQNLVIDQDPALDTNGPMADFIAVAMGNDGRITITGLFSPGFGNGPNRRTLVNGNRSVTVDAPRNDLIVKRTQDVVELNVAMQDVQFVNGGSSIRIDVTTINMLDCFTFTHPRCDIVVTATSVTMTDCWAQRDMRVAGTFISVDGGFAGRDMSADGFNVELDDCWATGNMLVGTSGSPKQSTLTSLVDCEADALSIVTGDSRDDVVITTSEFRTATIHTHGGNDEVVLDDLDADSAGSQPLAMDSLVVKLGAGSDVLWVRRSTVDSVELSGGTKNDFAYNPQNNADLNNFWISTANSTGFEAIKTEVWNPGT